MMYIRPFNNNRSPAGSMEFPWLSFPLAGPTGFSLPIMHPARCADEAPPILGLGCPLRIPKDTTK